MMNKFREMTESELEKFVELAHMEQEYYKTEVAIFDIDVKRAIALRDNAESKIMLSKFNQSIAQLELKRRASEPQPAFYKPPTG